MKSRSLFFAFVGLGLFSCTNENLNDGTIDGVADVTVNIDMPGLMSGRSLDNFTSSNQEVTPSYISITLEAEKGGKTVSGKYSELVASGKYTFEGVQSPKSLKVDINTKNPDGGSDIAYKSIKELNAIKVEDARMTGSTTTFTADGSNTKYTAKVTMNHTMARIEVGGITHPNDHDSGSCIFQSGKLTGVMLNKVVEGLGEGDAQNSPRTYSESEIDTYFGDSYTEGLWDKITANNTFFPSTSAAIPANSQAFGYNIYPVTSGQLPVLTLYFTDIAAAVGAPTYVGTNGFAFIDRYKISDASGAEVIKALCGDSAEDAGSGFKKVKYFPAGYVYQINNIEVPDNAIHTTPDGSGLSLEATITVTPWTTVDGSADWTPVK